MQNNMEGQYRCKRPPEHHTDLTKIELPHDIIIKTSTETRERKLKAVREKKQIIYEGKPIKITADFSTKNIKREKSVG
jgi:hypothetical protein